jgi:hypothetical protein
MTDWHLEEEAAVRAYTDALSAFRLNDLRRDADGLSFDDRLEDDRLIRDLAAAARRWAIALIALGRPLPPGLEEEARYDLRALSDEALVDATRRLNK